MFERREQEEEQEPQPMSQQGQMGYNEQSNYGFVQSSALELRLDTQKVLIEIEKFLRGKMTYQYIDEKTGRIKTETVDVGKPKANDIGIQGIMALCKSILAPHIVQGNMTEEMYYNFMHRWHLRIADHLMSNLHNWEINHADFEGIMSYIVDAGEVFLTRTINNKERESYTQTVKSIENSRLEAYEPQRQKKWFGIV